MLQLPMPQSRWSAKWAAVVAMLILAANVLSAQGGRSFFPFPSAPIARIGGLDDDILLNPGPIACRGDRLVLFDYGDMKLKAFGPKGQLLWSVGERGSGPGEYRNPTDIKIAANGQILVRDPQAARVTYVRSGGTFLRTIGVQSQNHQLLPLQDGNVMLVGASQSGFAVIVDSLGHQVRELPLTAGQSATPSISRQTVIAQAEDGGGVIAFLYGSGFALVDATGRLRFFEGIESVTFPAVLTFKVGDKKQYTSARVDPRALHGSHSVAIDASQVFARFGGGGSRAGRILDTYRRATGAYAGSYELPEGTLSIAVCGGFLYLRSQEPVPMVTVYRTPDRR